MSDLLLPDGRSWQAVKGLPIIDGGAGISGDATVTSVIAGGAANARVADLEVYWMLAMRHPYIRSCLSLLADAVSSEGYDVVPADELDAKPLTAKDDPRVGDIHTFFREAWRQPGTAITERASRASITLDIGAFGYALARVKRAGGLCVGLERLDPRTVQAQLNEQQTAIEQFIIRRLTTAGTFDNSKVEKVPAKDVLVIATAGGDLITGLASPLEALDLTAACDLAARRFREAAFRKGVFPGTVLSNPTASVEQVKAVETKIRAQKSGASNAYDLMMLAGDWKMISVAEAGKNDADFVKATALNREDICGVYKVPVGMLTFAGNALGSSGKGDDRDFFEQFAVLPLEETIYEALTLRLLADEFGINDLQLVPKRRNRIRYDRFDAALKAVKFGFTGNEARRIVNAPAIIEIDPEKPMDVPLFIGATGTNGFANDEATAPAAQTATDDGGAAGASADGAEARNEVAQKGASRFRIYGF